jgi:hypothetical protein
VTLGHTALILFVAVGVNGCQAAVAGH